jgi:hypothetical protein
MTISIPMVLLILAFGPLGWSFPWWLWAIAIFDLSLSTTVKLCLSRIRGVK